MGSGPLWGRTPFVSLRALEVLPPTLPHACQKCPQLVQDTRLKKGLTQDVKDGHNQQLETYQADVEAGRAPRVANPDENLFVSCPRMRLIFYLYEPVLNVLFKIGVPLILVLVLMLMNFHENYGPLDDTLGTCPSEERDPGYLANAIGIVITAAFVIPELACRKELVKSPNIRCFSVNELMPALFLAGLALATVRKCLVVSLGILLNCWVPVSMVFGALLQLYTCRKLKKETATSVPQVVEASKNVSNFDIDRWRRASVEGSC
ncbi:expressed unknown protein [Ectocarpus siliculosus]|uniref:Uncharacterized protein n=1 Tax=Ectocarpus siliculosus TaxID=2880 RepID=D8LHA5_ECTSI|nr:expressed unknown protein [Ectocarpus siliculosus]|eukprot:CBN74324.1 expressed unknown protein [Ectocarpus siliculosus]